MKKKNLKTETLLGEQGDGDFGWDHGDHRGEEKVRSSIGEDGIPQTEITVTTRKPKLVFTMPKGYEKIFKKR